MVGVKFRLPRLRDLARRERRKPVAQFCIKDDSAPADLSGLQIASLDRRVEQRPAASRNARCGFDRMRKRGFVGSLGFWLDHRRSPVVASVSTNVETNLAPKPN